MTKRKLSPSKGERLGYIRVSTTHQDLEAQRRALLDAGVRERNIYRDKMSGVRDDRPELKACLKALRPGDSLVLPGLDRLGRSLVHLVRTIEALTERRVNVVSLRESIDTSNAAGRLIVHVFCALAEFERQLIRERTKAGLAAKKAQGVELGRRPKLGEKELKRAKKLLANGELSVREVADAMGISKPTLFRYFPGGRAAVRSEKQ